jgi:hypothetical protein
MQSAPPASSPRPGPGSADPACPPTAYCKRSFANHGVRRLTQESRVTADPRSGDEYSERKRRMTPCSRKRTWCEPAGRVRAGPSHRVGRVFRPREGVAIPVPVAEPRIADARGGDPTPEMGTLWQPNPRIFRALRIQQPNRRRVGARRRCAAALRALFRAGKWLTRSLSRHALRITGKAAIWESANFANPAPCAKLPLGPPPNGGGPPDAGRDSSLRCRTQADGRCCRCNQGPRHRDPDRHLAWLVLQPCLQAVLVPDIRDFPHRRAACPGGRQVSSTARITAPSPPRPPSRGLSIRFGTRPRVRPGA